MCSHYVLLPASSDVFTPTIVGFRRCAHAMSARSPLTAYGNVRVGPTAMSFVSSLFSPTAFLRPASNNSLDKSNRSPKVTSLQADPEGVFFSSESAEKKHTGWGGQRVPSIPVMCSRHVGSVAAHRLRQRSRRPDRHVVCQLAFFSDCISA